MSNSSSSSICYSGAAKKTVFNPPGEALWEVVSTLRDRVSNIRYPGETVEAAFDVRAGQYPTLGGGHVGSIRQISESVYAVYDIQAR